MLLGKAEGTVATGTDAGTLDFKYWEGKDEAHVKQAMGVSLADFAQQAAQDAQYSRCVIYSTCSLCS